MAHAPEPEKSVGEIGERSLLRHLRSRIPRGEGVSVGVGDDAAALETGPLTLVTTDALVEGVHFQREWAPAALIGRKALTVNLSDIAAMAGRPCFATVSLALPRDVQLAFIDGLYDGLLERAAETGVSVVGGNVTAIDGPVVIDVTLIGAGDNVLRRAGAEPGDLVVVTGGLGAATAGLRLLLQGCRLGPEGEVVSTGIWTESSVPALLHCMRAQLDPTPPIAFARSLSEHPGLVHAAIDISDGISGDLYELCRESGVLALIDPATIPVDKHASALERARGGDPQELALQGAEDYQLLLAVPPDNLDGVKDLAVVWDLPITVLGEFAEGAPAVTLKRGDRLAPLPPGGYDPFRALGPQKEPPARKA